MAKARITFRSEVTIEGKDLSEIKDIFETTELFSEEARKKLAADFIEITSIEDEYLVDIKDKWDDLY